MIMKLLDAEVLLHGASIIITRAMKRHATEIAKKRRREPSSRALRYQMREMRRARQHEPTGEWWTGRTCAPVANATAVLEYIGVWKG